MAFDPNKYKISTAARFMPVVLLLDVSGSMRGDKINNLYAATVKMIETFADESKKEIPYKIAIITFGSSVDYHTLYADATKDLARNLTSFTAYGMTLLGTALRMAKDLIEDKTETKTRWFAQIIPVYKDAASVAVSNMVGDMSFAFYCTEFCKGRNLIDHFEDILTTKDYLLTPHDKNILAEYERLLNSGQSVYEYAAALNNDALRLNAEIINLTLQISNELFKNKLRQQYSENMILKNVSTQNQNIWRWEEILKNFDVRKNQASIPKNACLIEFMKISDDSLLVNFLRNEGDIQAANIPVDKNFFENCNLYHALNSYANLDAMRSTGNFLWNVNGKYKITNSNIKSSKDENAVTDNSQFIELREKLSAEISAKLIPVLEKFAGNDAHWIISPDAELNLVPFETLTFNKKFLVESKNISYVPSLAVMHLMRERERKNSYLGQSKELFAMGNAIYNAADSSTSRGSQQNFFNKLRNNPEEKIDITSLRWGELPGTEIELDKVSTLFENKTIFRRAQATEKNLQALNNSGELSKYKYLLFAAHGLFVPEKPELSSIVLSQQFNDENHDGYITVGEWMGYDLRSNLIYLSACESGRGNYQAGEGIVGIPYALTVAGNKDTVMSLWKVDDTATAEFTSAVFEKLRRGKSEVSALNETKREFLKQKNPAYRAPSIWAAFILYGI